QRSEAFGFDRSSTQITLVNLATQRAQKVELCLGFDTLCDYHHAQAFGQIDNSLHDGRVVQVVWQIFDEAPVNLQFVDRKAFQIVQTGISGAEIVDRQAHAHFVELVEGFRSLLRILHDCVLGKFNLQLMGLDSVAGECCRYVLDKIGPAEL